MSARAPRLARRAVAVAVALSPLAFPACGGDGGSTSSDGSHPDEAYPYEHLSSYALFAGAAAEQRPADGVFAYEVNAPLWSDDALKHRFIALREGGKIVYSDTEPWEFPTGAVLVKTFAFPRDARDPDRGERLVETRLLVHEASGWTAHTYLWDDAQQDAVRTVAGATVPVSWIDAGGATHTLDYVVPNTNQCATCHARNEPAEPIGARTRQLDGTFDLGDGAGARPQLERLADAGLFDRAPSAPEARTRLTDWRGDGPLEARARGFLDANCAHCHRSGGFAASSGLWLNAEETRPASLGICRRPIAAGHATGGHHFDIVPGRPDESVMPHRMSSLAPEVKMPVLPNVTVNEPGVALIRAWIAAMPETAPTTFSGPMPPAGCGE